MCSVRRAHPRSRGEHVPLVAEGGVQSGSSPLTRGALSPRRATTRAGGLIPAHAGSTLVGSFRETVSWAHPRSRGEHFHTTITPADLLGSSPLTRGAHVKPARLADTRGLIPAHAGSTIPLPPLSRRCRAHPRSRGEHSSTVTSSSTNAGSSPLTRGARFPLVQLVARRGLIPAHAGSTRRPAGLLALGGAHPRSRGEHFPSHGARTQQMGSSPLTRGAP